MFIIYIFGGGGGNLPPTDILDGHSLGEKGVLLGKRSLLIILNWVIRESFAAVSPPPLVKASK